MNSPKHGPLFDPDAALDDGDAAVLDALARLRNLVDPAPAGLADRSLFAVTLARLEGEVMDLVEHGSTLAGVRGADVEARTITFTATRMTIMITLTAGTPVAHGVRIDGWVAPSGDVVVELVRPAGQVLRTAPDADGRFVLDRVAPGPASLVVRDAHDDTPEVSTPVIEI